DAANVELERPGLSGAARDGPSRSAHVEAGARSLEHASRRPILAGHRVQIAHGLVVRVGTERLEPAEPRLAKRDPEHKASRYFTHENIDAGRKIGRAAAEQAIRRRRVQH